MHTKRFNHFLKKMDAISTFISQQIFINISMIANNDIYSYGQRLSLFLYNLCWSP